MESITEILKRIKDNPPINPQVDLNTYTTNDLIDNCLICHGLHFVHPTNNDKVDYSRLVPCKCIKDEWAVKKQQALLKYCELPPMAENLKFETYNAYNSDLAKVLGIAKKIGKNPQEFTWVVFTGSNGIGKTHLAISICREWIKSGVAAKYAFVPLLLDELREGFGKNGDDGYTNRFRTFCEVPLLLLDDLGAESSTSWVNEKLETIVDSRYMNKKSLIVTTNKTLEEMTPRLASRLIRPPNRILIQIKTDDYRLRDGK